MQPLRTLQRTRLRPAARLSAVLLLALFLAVRGLVPAGYMPAAVASGSLYGLCHGDARSAFLLQSLAAAAEPAGGQHHHHNHHQGHHGDPLASADTPHSGHDHSPATGQAFADNHCSFAASAALAVAVPPLYFSDTAQAGFNNAQRLNGFLPAPHFLRPQGRAPPTPVSS
ncbi:MULTISPECIES: hypothetical protein [Microbulbifer]|uniref:hypothetical protein n=1 Tax=Microbulbifer TaxID=48073 RepID=UPI000745FF80|nr:MULTISPECIES: hypothetical protein [Microbulbifer]KUJ83828.1 hypothetical protein AVO43_08375 [Microbulbifer sp. ZGT114]